LERQKEEKAKQEKLLQKDKEKELKIKQRNEVQFLSFNMLYSFLDSYLMIHVRVHLI